MLILLNFLVVSCDSGLQGNLNENLPPSTSLTLDEITLTGGDRLTSQVDISWWGDDPDGYIIGYEYFIGDADTAGDADWLFTERSDSTFILPIPEGNKEADVIFNVRAIDDDEARDPEPPSLVFPIENSNPETSFKSGEIPPDTTYRIASFGFEASDPDGQQNLNNIEIALNDTTGEDSWKEIPLEVDFITIRIDDTIDNQEATVFIGRTAVETDIRLTGVNLNADNEFFVRATDNAGAVSAANSFTWYVKKQTSRILFVNDYETQTNSRGAFHKNLLSKVGISEVDYINISDGSVVGGSRVPLSSALPNRALGEPTINMMLAEWDYIYWISNDMSRNIGYAQELLGRFFNQGGKIFMNIPIEPLGDRNPLYEFMPFGDVTSPPDIPTRSPNFRLESCTDAIIQPVESGVDISPMRLNRRLQPFYPIVPFSEAVPLFEADFQLALVNPRETREYDENEVIAAMGLNEDGEGQRIYFGLDLEFLTYPGENPCMDPEADPEGPEEEKYFPVSDTEGLLEYMIIDKLGFEQ